MARFYGEVFGTARTAASRLGHRDIGAHVRGWDVGVRIGGRVRGDVDRDVFYLYATAGSSGGASDVYIGRVTLDDNGRPTFTAAEDANQ